MYIERLFHPDALFSFIKKKIQQGFKKYLIYYYRFRRYNNEHNRPRDVQLPKKENIIFTSKVWHETENSNINSNININHNKYNNLHISQADALKICF